MERGNARAYSVNDAQRHHPNSVIRRGQLHQEQVPLKKRAHSGFRVCQLNIGSMTERGRELAALMREKKVDLMYVQETLRICYGGEVLDIISVYAPQVGCTEEEKGNFWRDMDGVMQELEEHERVIVGVDLNGHVGNEKEAIGQVHGGHGTGERKPEGESVVDFAISFDMAIANSFFTKRREHLITYRSGGRCSQIDYFLYKRIKLVEVKNCKVIPDDHVAPNTDCYVRI
ncbi:uncharacterized protein LOC135206366 [Macrobrachium nipponense]|uniref:uncharacterized protein LOC135206366 n=1 Tax=Macrobrachium nipponense TaxID=159736 RepID=UPI0030C83563